jgi:serine/threonine protein phosphatase PrpC
MHISFATRTKAGTNGKQPKINQDMAILESKLPFGVRLFAVCDGHGVNGHIVSSYIKVHLISNLALSEEKI